VAAPPPAMMNRQVVARNVPPPAAVPFAQQQQALQQNPGQPLSPTATRQFQQNAPVQPRGAVRQIGGTSAQSPAGQAAGGGNSGGGFIGRQQGGFGQPAQPQIQNGGGQGGGQTIPRGPTQGPARGFGQPGGQPSGQTGGGTAGGGTTQPEFRRGRQFPNENNQTTTAPPVSQPAPRTVAPPVSQPAPRTVTPPEPRGGGQPEGNRGAPKGKGKEREPNRRD